LACSTGHAGSPRGSCSRGTSAGRSSSSPESSWPSASSRPGKGWTARRPLYVGAIVLSLGYVVGYFGWHLSGHRPLLIVGRGLPHDIDTVQFVLDHLFAGPLEFFAIFTEVTLAVVLAYLLVVERR